MPSLRSSFANGSAENTRNPAPTNEATASHPVCSAEGPPDFWGATTWFRGVRLVVEDAPADFRGVVARAREEGLCAAIPPRYPPLWRVRGIETHGTKCPHGRKEKTYPPIPLDSDDTTLIPLRYGYDIAT